MPAIVCENQFLLAGAGDGELSRPFGTGGEMLIPILI
jgi:hypothetical protein